MIGENGKLTAHFRSKNKFPLTLVERELIQLFLFQYVSTDDKAIDYEPN